MMNNNFNKLLAVGAGVAGGLTGYFFSQRWPTDTGLVKKTQEQTDPDIKSGETLKDENVDVDPSKNVDEEMSTSVNGEIKDPSVKESEPNDFRKKESEEGGNDEQTKEETKKKTMKDNKFALSPLPPFP